MSGIQKNGGERKITFYNFMNKNIPYSMIYTHIKFNMKK